MALPIYNVDLYEAGKKQWKDLTPEGKIFHALLHGAKATSGFANTVGETTEGGRYLRFIRQDGHPLEVTHHKSNNGGTYYEYSFSKEHIAEIREQMKQPVSSHTLTN